MPPSAAGCTLPAAAAADHYNAIIACTVMHVSIYILNLRIGAPEGRPMYSCGRMQIEGRTEPVIEAPASDTATVSLFGDGGGSAYTSHCIVKAATTQSRYYKVCTS